MHDTPNPMGGPEPVNDRESNLFGNILGAIAVAVSGVVLFAHFLGATRARGASHSAKLKWQQRECEVDQAIAAQRAVDDGGRPSDGDAHAE